MYTSASSQQSFNQILSGIDSNQPLLLLPVRLETHFRDGYFPEYPTPGKKAVKSARKEYRRELCVRIFPDEIFLDYSRTSLSPDELEAGKIFWIQWFIASGSYRWEFSAWETLCEKFPPSRAAWIARMTRIEDLDKYRAGDPGRGIPEGKLFYRRPYTRMDLVDKACDAISENLSGVILEKTSKTNPDTGETECEYLLRTSLEKIKDNLAVIDRDIMTCEVIVDYIYDKIAAALDYLTGRLKSFRDFYDRYPALYADNRRTMEIWDKDYTILCSMERDVQVLAEKLTGKRISLDAMIRRYLEDEKNDVFHVSVLPGDADPPMPATRLLPEQFLLIAEPMEPGKPLRYRYGNRVNPKLQMVPTPEALDRSIDLDGNGGMEWDGELRWMADYEQAWSEGMAISLPLEKDETEFRYIYVLGVRGQYAADAKRLQDLINGHNYLGEGMAFIGKDSPTNLVEGGAGSDVTDEEEEIRLRFEMEVNDSWRYLKARDEDARRLSDVLQVDFGDSLGHVLHYDRKDQLKTRIATRTLWDRVMSRIDNCDEDFRKFLNFVGQFLEDNVSATGPLPMFRIGDNPYGILPVTDHEQVVSLIKSSEDTMLRILYDTLLALGNEWKRLRNGGVVAADRMAGPDAERNFLKMAGQSPRSLDVYGRYMIDSPLLPDRGAEAAGAVRYLQEADDLRATPVEDAYSLASLDSQKNAVKAALKKNGLEVGDDELESLVFEFLDLFSYRLDAWFTGMAWYLQTHPEERTNSPMRRQPAIGAYGWVFNLRENRATSKAAKDEGEYILAPSLQHALTAAVLRSAYLNTQKDGGDSHMCINLSSMRARTALRMIDGIKNGLSTGVVLGADLERYLHDAHKLYGKECELDSLIYPLRKLFPQSIDIQAEKKEDGRVQAANYMMQVINGEYLLNTFLTKWNYDGRLSVWLDKNRKNLNWYTLLCKCSSFKDNQKKRTALFESIERMYDAYDALNDLLLSEGVHRLILGDSASFEAISKFMANGGGNLPDPGILKTPMDYAAVVHKVAVALPVTATSAGFLGKAEPSLDAWVKEKVGSMENIRFKVAYSAIPDGPATWSDETLAALGVNPLEYLYLSGNDHAFKTLLEYRWRIREGLFRGSVTIYTGDPAENETFEQAELPRFSLYEDSLRVSSIRALVSESSVMTVTDFNPDIVSDQDILASTDMEDLSSRYANLFGALEALSLRMKEALDAYRPDEGLSDEGLAEILALQAECLSAGVFEAAVSYPAGLSLKDVDPISMRTVYDEILAAQKRFMTQFKEIRTELRRRLDKAAEIVPAVYGGRGSISDYTLAMKTLTLEAFVVIPRFHPREYLREDWRDEHLQALREGLSYYENVGAESFLSWLDEVAAVQTGVNRWNKIAMFQEMACMPEEVPCILQRRKSLEGKRHWLGLPTGDGMEPDDTDSLVIFGQNRLSLRSAGSPCAGLVFDNWVEYLPFEDHTAGMVFRCDQPDAEAPQAILLATYPELAVARHYRWDLSHVLNILDSTRFQLMNRAVDPDLIANDEKLSKVFPLLTDARINARNVQFVFSSYVPKNKVRSILEHAIFGGIFEYMPGGAILKEFLNDNSYEQ